MSKNKTQSVQQELPQYDSVVYAISLKKISCYYVDIYKLGNQTFEEYYNTTIINQYSNGQEGGPACCSMLCNDKIYKYIMDAFARLINNPKNGKVIIGSEHIFNVTKKNVYDIFKAGGVSPIIDYPIKPMNLSKSKKTKKTTKEVEDDVDEEPIKTTKSTVKKPAAKTTKTTKKPVETTDEVEKTTVKTPKVLIDESAVKTPIKTPVKTPTKTPTKTQPDTKVIEKAVEKILEKTLKPLLNK